MALVKPSGGFESCIRLMTKEQAEAMAKRQGPGWHAVEKSWSTRDGSSGSTWVVLPTDSRPILNGKRLK